MGLHQLIFSIYTFASAIASSGISIAVTRLVAEQIGVGGKRTVNKILSRALALSIFLGFFAFALMFFSADIIAEKWLCDMRSALSLKILSFGLPFMAICSCLKGYFTARRKVSTPSNSQLFEQLIRIGCVMLLTNITNSKNLSTLCACVVCGNAVSEVGACIYIYIGYLRDKRLLPEGKTKPVHILRSLSAIFIPVALSSYLNTILHTIENIMVPDALTRYTHIREISLSQFGALKGMALPLLFFPASFLGALSSLLIPEIAEYKVAGKTKALKYTISQTMLITSVTSVLISLIFAIYSKEIGYMVYKSEEVGFFMLALSPIIPFMYTECIVAGILNGLNQQNASLRYNVYNSMMRIALITIFVPKFGIRAFLVIMAVSNLFTSCLSTNQLLRVVGMRAEVKKWIIKPMLCAFFTFVCAYILNPTIKAHLHNNFVAIITEIMVSSAIYIVCLFLSKVITKSDFNIFLGRNRRKEQKC